MPSWRVSSSFVKLLRIDVILGAAFCSSSDVDGCNTNLDVLCWHMALRIIGYYLLRSHASSQMTAYDNKFVMVKQKIGGS